MKRLRIYQVFCVCVLGLLAFLPTAWAASTISVSGKSPLAGANVIFQPYSIEKVYPGGVVQKQYFPDSPGNAHVGNLWVDVPTPGFQVVNTEIVGSNATTIVYRIDAESDLPLNLYTKTLATDIATQATTSVTWCDYLRYDFVKYWPYAPSNVYKITNGLFKGITTPIDPKTLPANVYGDHAAFTFADTKMKPITLPSGKSVTPEIAFNTNTGIDEYRDLVVKVGYNNPGPVEFSNTDNASIKINFATTAWQVTGLYATDEWRSYPLGSYKVDYINIGKEQGSVHIYSYTEQLVQQNAYMTELEKQKYAEYAAAEKIGWMNIGIQPRITVQQGVYEGPTMGNALVTAGNRMPANNTIAEVNLGYHIRPNVVKDVQLYDVTPGQITFYDSAPWPYENAIGISNLVIGTTDQVKQNLYVMAENTVIRQNWKTCYSFYVECVPTNIPTTAILGMPKMEQANMVIDASVGGQTDLTAYINDADPLGSFVRTAGGLIDEILSWLWPILIIIIAFLAVIYIVPGLFKKIGGKK